MNTQIKFSYVLPEPARYRDWAEFDADLAAMRQAGYDAVELQIADPREVDEDRLRRSLQAVGLGLAAVQSGGTYATRGNCLCTRDDAVRARTTELLEAFVDFAARWRALIVFGSLQGRASDESDFAAGRRRIVAALTQVCRYATPRGVTLALEPVNHLEVTYHHTVASVVALVHEVAQPSARLMIDTFHLNIEERTPLVDLPALRELLVHVHLSETNRDVLGAGHWDTAGLLHGLAAIGYAGYCSVGVYHTALSRRECLTRCLAVIRAARS